MFFSIKRSLKQNYFAEISLKTINFDVIWYKILHLYNNVPLSYVMRIKYFGFMSKFGELINAQVPVLIDFYTEWNESSVSMHTVIRDVAAALGDKAKVIKIDVDKNQELAEALRIKGLPTLMIYKEGQMVWRQSGELDANTIIGLVQEQV